LPTRHPCSLTEDFAQQIFPQKLSHRTIILDKVCAKPTNRRLGR
jgi:hypothetical protein